MADIRALIAARVKAAQDLTYWQSHGTHGDGQLQAATKRCEATQRAIVAHVGALEQRASMVLAQPGTVSREDRERLAVSLAEAILNLDAEND